MAKQFTDDLDLMPAAEAAVRRGASRFSYVLSLMIVVFLAVFFLWAHSAALDEVTRGDAQVVPSSRIQVIQNLEGGIVGAILVREGDIVRQGQVLVRIDNVGASSKYEDAFKRSLVSSAAIARLEAELHDLPLKFSPQLAAAAPDTIDTQKMLYNTRKRQIESQLSVLHAQAAQRTQEVAELRSRLQQLQQSVVLTRKEHDIAEPLVKEGLMARTDLIRVQQELNRLNGEIRTLRLAIPRAEKAVTEMQQRIEEVTNTFYAGVARELSDERAMFQSLQKVLAEGKDRVSRTEVTSPVRGVVQSLKKNTLGGVVKPGEDIVEVVPLDSTLVVEAMIKPQDIAFLRPEQTATVKISAYDFASYGGLKGVVENISADTVEDERGNRFFRVRVRTQQASLKHGGAELPIIPGMTASVEILTGQKTVLDYLLKPLRLAQDKALRER